MRIVFRIVFLLLLLLAVQPALAATLKIESPQYIIENENIEIHVILNSSVAFGGNVFLAFANTESSVSSFPFTEANLASGVYNYSFAVKGLVPGSYQINATAKNSSGDDAASISKTGAVNSSMPIIMSSSPSGLVSKDNAIMAVRTNEIASCRFDTSNTSYANMSSVFSNTNSNLHNQSLSLSQGEKVYFVRCQDANGYAMQDSYQVKFNVDLPPSAGIELSDETPVKTGMIEIELIASESLDSAPSLEYQYNDGTAKKTVSLSGSGSKWEGFIIVSEADDNKIGTFYFSAIDSSGNIGTKITKGGVFVVDAKKPNPPISIKAVSEPDGRIKLSWYYDGEHADYFRIYRSASPGVDYVDYYADSNKSVHFTDRSTIDKVTYYYRISTVDDAQNEGSLSDEVYATSLREGQIASTVTEEKKVLPPGLVPFVEDKIKKVESLIIDASLAEEIIKGITGEEKEIIKEIKAEQAVLLSKSQLESLITRLEAMKGEYATEAELLAKLEDINIEIRNIEKSTPKGARLIEKSDFAQTSSREDIEKAVKKALGALSEQDINAYIERNDKEKAKAKVDASIRVFEVTYLDGSKAEKSWIRKKISYSAAQMPNDVLVIETVPKSVAEDASELNFGSQLAEVIDNDPVIKFGFHEFGEEGEQIYYFIEKRASAEEMKDSRTVFLLNPNSFAAKTQVTGNSIFGLEKFNLGNMQNMLVWIGATLVLGIFGYYYVFVREPVVKERTTARIEREAKEAPFKNYATDEIFEELSGHMKDVKAEMADKLLPLFVALNQKIESKKSVKSSETDYQMLLMNALIDQAHGYIDNNLHDEAVKIYPRISDLYRKLSKEQRDDIFARCSHLHRRIHFKRPF